jgi:hypothetical protein
MSVSKSATRAAATSVRASDGGLRSFAASAEGSLPAPEAAALAPTEDLLGPGRSAWRPAVGCCCQGGRLHAPRTFFASRKGSPTLVTARRFRAAS